MINLDDAELFASSELRHARLDGHDAPPFRELFAARGVTFRLASDADRLRAAAEHCWCNGRPFVYVHKSLIGGERAFAALHEFGHVVVERDELPLCVGEERWVQRFASACILPGDSLRRAHRTHGLDLPALADARPQACESVVARRVGDLEIARVWLFQRGRLRAGDHAPPPTVVRLASIAQRSGYAENDNARAWRLRDEPARVAVIET